GLVAYDLQAPAKNLYPVIVTFSKRIPRVSGRGGTATNWKQVSGITGSGFNAMGWVPEGQRSGVMSLTTADKSASYRTIGEEGSLSFEAASAAEGFEDERSRTSIRLLQKAMLKEDAAVFGGNASLALGTPATPTTSAAGTGATLTAATYNVYVVALTFEGFENSSLSGGVATTQTITGADGKTYNLAGGSSNKSTAASQAVTLGQTLTASVTTVDGAVAYAWFVGTSGNEKLEAITTVSTASFSAPLAGTGQAASAITADNSKNANYAFDGILTVALDPSTDSYVKDLGGATLTGSGRGSIDEIDVALKAMWDQYRLSPTVIYVSSQEMKNITDKVLTATSSSLLRQNATVNEPGAIVAGNKVRYYYNPFTNGNGEMIDIELAPNVPPGTIVGWADNLPAQYQSSEVPNVAEMKLRRDWYDIEWPLKTREYEHGIYAEETLAVYAPFALMVIKNIGNG
ncbi:MAG TPA: hypothetical protein VKA32_01440, partial [Gammaproteobacteria bacterium]|nr:hypothetical protein [Gammaproteobacteria bacterium]